MPSGKLSVNVVTEKDAEDLKFIAQLDPEYVAASFVGTGNDIVRVRRELEKNGNFNIKIVAKVERPVALENIDDIIRESDALMVARGDLGVEIDAWDVPKWCVIHDFYDYFLLFMYHYSKFVACCLL
jgi:pyruvate kinase